MSARNSMGLKPQLPVELGRYTLHEEIGSGGMATVYLAHMQLAAGAHRLVALKTIHSHLAKESQFLDMFLDEAVISSQISHPNCCAVYDFGEADGVYYLAMEYLVGEPLDDYVLRVRKKQSRELVAAVPYLAARMMADASEGLHAAHTLRGSDGEPLHVVHRDVSPQNLFVTYEGAVKVVDFGCAKAMQRVTQTDVGIMKGKVAYASPEQLRGQDLDARSDVFAIGACLWELLTLRRLFGRESQIETAKAVLEAPIERADDRYPWVPEQLADIAEKCLQRDPDDRYQSARDVSRALRSFIAGSGVSFESAEVAEWMEHLFSERHREHRALIARVEATSSADSESGVVDAPDVRKPDPVAARSSSQISRRMLMLPEDESRPRSTATRGSPWPIVAVLLAGAAGGGYFLWDQQPSGLDGEELAELEPTTVDEGSEPEEIELHPTGSEMLEEPEPTAPESSAMSSRMARRSAMTSSMSSSSRSEDLALTQAAQAEETRNGEVRIETRGGWATVLENGRVLGRTPRRFELAPGTHHLTVRPYGQGDGVPVRVRSISGTLQTYTLDVGDPPSMTSMSSTASSAMSSTTTTSMAPPPTTTVAPLPTMDVLPTMESTMEGDVDWTPDWN